MRRLPYLSAGVLELCAAVVLVALVWELPGPVELRTIFGRAERVGEESSSSVRRLRQQLNSFGERQPEMQKIAGQMQRQLKQVSEHLANQQIDFQAIEAVRDALGDVADGLKGLGEAMDPKTAERLGMALGATGQYLDEKVAPAAARAAEQLEAASEGLRVEAESLSAAFRHAAKGGDPRLAAHLEDVEDGLAWLARQTTPEGMTQWRRKLDRGAQSVAQAASLTAALSQQTYPSMTFTGLIPTVVEKPIWPEGKATAEKLRQASLLLSGFHDALGSLGPSAAAGGVLLERARQEVARMRRSLAAEKPGEMALLRNLPEQAARLAESLPKLTQGVVRLLRDTDRLKEVAAVLGQARKGIDNMIQTWPDLQRKLGRTVDVLRMTRKHLDDALKHRQEYERSVKGVAVLAETLGSSLPVFTTQLERDLAEQERSLQGLEQSINDASAVLPDCEKHATRLVQLTRLLLSLLALVIGLHALYLAGLGGKKSA